MGLGSCWVGFGSMVTDNDEVKRILNLGDDETIFGPILLGCAQGYPERPRKKEFRVKVGLDRLSIRGVWPRERRPSL